MSVSFQILRFSVESVLIQAAQNGLQRGAAMLSDAAS